MYDQSRREFIFATGVAVSTGLAGCSGDTTTGGVVGQSNDDTEPEASDEHDITFINIVDNLDATDVTSNSATLNGALRTLDSGYSALCCFRWRQAGEAPNSETSKQLLTSTGSYSAEIGELDPGTEYEYWAVARMVELDPWGVVGLPTVTESEPDEYAGRINTFTTQ